MTSFRNISIFVLVSAFFLSGCGAGVVKPVPVSLNYLPSKKAELKVPHKLGSVALGQFVDSRAGRPSAALGERIHFTKEVDRFQPKGGVTGSLSNIVRGYYAKRKVRIISSKWDGKLSSVRNQNGDIVLSGRIEELWFASTDHATMGSASSVFRLIMKVGSPKSGKVITKTIQIKPESKRNIFWESKEVEKWLSQTISEALDRIMPGIENRLAG
jgi:hypothetical protein